MTQTGRWRRLMAGALAVALSAPAAAEQADVAALLKPLDLRRYPSRTPPPLFGGRTVDGALSMADFRGKVVLVNFWASWCAECRPEMPVLDSLYREFGRHGFAVLGINAREDAAKVRGYATQLDLTFPLVLDVDGRINAQYGVIGLPTTFLIGRDGRAVAFAVGAREWGGAAARALIEALLAESPPQAETR